MKKVIIISLVFVTFTLKAQVITIKHTNYTSEFDIQKHIPVEVTYWLTKAHETCKHLKRSNNFAPDPLYPILTNLQKYYDHSGYDRGHNDAAEDNECQGQQVLSESFYFSNMTPQTPGLNRGSWKALETSVRELAIKDDSIHVWVGSLGEQGKLGIVTIPKEMWKVFYDKKTGIMKAYLFYNDKNDAPNKPQGNEVAVSIIENATGFKFEK